MEEWYDDEITPLCCNCEYEGKEYSCNCKQRAEDIKNGCKRKDLAYDFCDYFEIKKGLRR